MPDIRKILDLYTDQYATITDEQEFSIDSRDE